jgi:hypothetical protein
MPYKLTTFDGLTLPTYNPTDPTGSGEALSQNVPLWAGAYDPYGSEETYSQGSTITKRCTVAADTSSALVTAVRAVRAKHGVRGKLYRQWDNGDSEWVWARLVRIEGDREPGQLRHAEMQITWVIESAVWSNASATTSNTDLTGTPQNISLTNSGNAAVKNAIITVTMPAALPDNDITALTFAAGDAEFTYSGTLTDGDVLVVDTGARSVTLNGADDYDNFSLTASHAISEWLRLAAGANTLTVTATGPTNYRGSIADLTGYDAGIIGPPSYASGSIAADVIDVQVEFYNQWR